jgi:hypothetical protein
MRKMTRFSLRTVDNTLYLSFQGSPEVLFFGTDEVFPLTADLDPYIGPEINALLDKDGRALGLSIHRVEEYCQQRSLESGRSGRKGTADFQLQPAGDKAYLLFPFAQRGRVHHTTFLSKDTYFREGVNNPDIILDLDEGGVPRGVEILLYDFHEESE